MNWLFSAVAASWTRRTAGLGGKVLPKSTVVSDHSAWYRADGLGGDYSEFGDLDSGWGK